VRRAPIAGSVVALLALGGATAALGSAARGPARTTLVDGDSLAAGTAPYLPGDLHGWRVSQSYSISRHAPDGVSLLRSYGKRLPRVVVLSLGTNDDPRAISTFRAEVRRAARIAGAHRCIVWANVFRPPVVGTSYAGYNRVLRQEDRSHANLRVYDWVRTARRHRYWFGPDGVHPTATGYQVRARELARSVRRCHG
jgi:lysophospholipase L1-like esterase